MAGGGKRIDEHVRRREQIPDAVKYEADMLYHAIERSAKLLHPLPGRLGSPPPFGPATDFKIGLISRNVKIKTSGDLETFSPALQLYGKEMAPYYHLCRPGLRQMIEQARTSLTEKVASLAEQGANVICVSELGYPAFESPSDGAISKKEEKLLRQGDVEFRKGIQAIADERRCIILCGSYHDVHELTNKGILFVPGDSEQIEHRKLTTADSTGIGEVVRTSKKVAHLIYETELGRIGILICKDAYDLNVFFRYALIGSALSSERVPDLILVPAWSRTSLAEACKELSYFARTAVAYVDGKSSPRSALFVGGECVSSEDEREMLLELPWADRFAHIERATREQSLGIFASVYGTRTGMDR